MRTHSIVSIVIAIAGLLGGSGFAGAQTATSATPAPPHVPLQKTIGQAGPDIVPSLIVMNSRGATLQDGKLTLTGVSPNSIVFADRPVRAAGHALTKHLLDEWTPGESEDNFAKNPPNATISAFSKDGTAIRDAVIVMKTPKLEGDQLTFDVDVLEGDLTGADGAASVFIDRFGFAGAGFGRGFAGVGRVGVGRVGFAGRGAWYRGAGVGLGAAALGGAALGAAAANAGYGYGSPACGYYPYPPCY